MPCLAASILPIGLVSNVQFTMFIELYILLERGWVAYLETPSKLSLEFHARLNENGAAG